MGGFTFSPLMTGGGVGVAGWAGSRLALLAACSVKVRFFEF